MMETDNNPSAADAAKAFAAFGRISKQVLDEILGDQTKPYSEIMQAAQRYRYLPRWISGPLFERERRRILAKYEGR